MENNEAQQSLAPCRVGHERRLHGVIHSRSAGLASPSIFKEESGMKYFNAQKLLPEPLLREVQSYVQGGYIYVP